MFINILCHCSFLVIQCSIKKHNLRVKRHPFIMYIPPQEIIRKRFSTCSKIVFTKISNASQLFIFTMKIISRVYIHFILLHFQKCTNMQKETL